MASMNVRRTVYAAIMCALAIGSPPLRASDQSQRQWIDDIRHADYAGDRAALATLIRARPITTDAEPTASRLHYWRGFASWRRALNGLNDSADRSEIADDLQLAVDEFDAALAGDPSFVDAKVAKVSCLQNLAFVHAAEPDVVQALVAQFVPLFREAQRDAPDNPRLLWVQGASEWYAAATQAGDLAGRRAAAMATYERGLRLARTAHTTGVSNLDPDWGEPELLMNLAFANLNKPTPDLRAAEDLARQALALVPYWHYVRDILMKQIQAAKVRS